MGELNPIYKELATKIGGENMEYVPKILAKVATLEEAKILMEMPVKSIEELAEKVKIDKASLEQKLQILYEKGLVLPRKKGGYRTVYALTELKDTTPSNPKFDEEYGEEFFSLWDEFFDSDEFRQWWENLPRDPNRTTPTMRVIPKWKSIKDVPGAMWFDDIRYLLKRREDKLGINNCSCRRVSRSHVPKEVPDEICFIEGATSDFCVSRGSGKRITLQEAMDILEETEKLPLVHLTYNEKPMEHLLGNCGAYCVVWRWSEPGTLYEGNPSRFQATINPELCLPGCKICVEACEPFFKAVQIKDYPEVGGDRAFIDIDKCWGCGNCVVQCPIGAISMKVVRPPEFVPDEYVGNY